MNRTEMSRRLREARELASINQGEAAEALGLPRTAVTQIEGGNRAVSTMELARLADLYRRPVSWFLADAPDTEEDVVVALHRIAPGLDADPEVRIEVDRVKASHLGLDQEDVIKNVVTALNSSVNFEPALREYHLLTRDSRKIENSSPTLTSPRPSPTYTVSPSTNQVR